MNVKEKTLVGGCAGEENGWNTQLLYFTGSSLSRDDKLLFMISDKGGSPNIVVRDLEKGTEKTLTQNSNGTRPAGRLQRLRALHDGSRHEPRVRRLLQVPRGCEDRAREQHGQRRCFNAIDLHVAAASAVEENPSAIMGVDGMRVRILSEPVAQMFTERNPRENASVPVGNHLADVFAVLLVRIGSVSLNVFAGFTLKYDERKEECR